KRECRRDRPDPCGPDHRPRDAREGAREVLPRMIDVTTRGLTRCSRCKRHNAGRLWLIAPMDRPDRGELVCNDPSCIAAVSVGMSDPGARPYRKVRCLPECDHPPVSVLAQAGNPGA